MKHNASARIVCVIAAFVATIAVGHAHESTSAGTTLRELMDESWEYSLEQEPLFATRAGDRRYNDRLPTVTVESYLERLARARGFLERLEAIPRDELDREGQIDRDVFGRLLRDRIAEMEFRTYLMPITNRSGFHVQFPQLARQVPLATVRDGPPAVRMMQYG